MNSDPGSRGAPDNQSRNGGVTDQHFNTPISRSDLRRRSVFGGAATLSSQTATFLVRMAGTVILARLLTPSDYGLVGMVAAVTGFVALFKDMGLSTATVQKLQIRHEEVSGLFWLNVAVSFVLAAVVALSSSAIALFYDEPRLRAISVVIGGFFIFGGLTGQHQALLRRQMKFGTLAAIRVVSVTVSILCAIAAAVIGAGYWALVVMHGAESLASVICVWSASKWRPGLPRPAAGIRQMVRFGMNLTGFNVVNYFARNADNILIGRVWGASALGLYSKAYAILMLPISQINAPLAAVAVPALSRLQDDPETFRRWYCRAANLVAFATTPLVLTLAVAADEVVLVVLGEQWADAAPIFRVLAIAAFGQPLANMTGWVFTALGRTDRMLRWGLVSSPVIVVAFAIGVNWGAIGVAIAYAVAVHAIRYPGYWYAFKGSPLSVGDLARAVWRPGVISGLMGLGMVAARHQLLQADAPVAAVLSGTLTAGLIAFFLTTLLWPSARTELLSVFRLLRDLRMTPLATKSSDAF